jgi:hypothetical protein
VLRESQPAVSDHHDVSTVVDVMNKKHVLLLMGFKMSQAGLLKNGGRMRRGKVTLLSSDLLLTGGKGTTVAGHFITFPREAHTCLVFAQQQDKLDHARGQCTLLVVARLQRVRLWVGGTVVQPSCQ